MRSQRTPLAWWSACLGGARLGLGLLVLDAWGFVHALGDPSSPLELLAGVGWLLSLGLLLGGLAGILGGLLLHLSARPKAPRVFALASLAPLAWLLFALSQGAWIRQQVWLWPARVLGLCGGALLLGLGIRLVARLSRARDPVRRAAALLALLVAALLLWIDAHWLRGLYPMLHTALWCGAWGVVGLGGAFWPVLVRRKVGAACLGVGLVGVAVGLGWLLSWGGPRGAVMRGTQSGGRAAALAAALGLGSAEPGAASPLAARPPLPWPPLAPRPNLAGADVVLITIDALRADRLGAFGSLQKLTPHLDQLAAQSVVFSRTYSPSPTSSYSLASLFCSRYALGRAHSQPGPWMTLAEHLSRFGYRTYATYNEGIFFTDAETFSHYQTTGFGFQHRRVAYLDAYDISRGGAASLLDGPGPAFVWLHVAEPHEPYQVRPGFHRGDSPQNRYDAEVAYADRHLEQILAPLRQRKAIVIVTADHGEAFGEHGAYYHTSDVYAEQSWVPLLVFYPGITPRRIDAPATLIDLAPTLLELLGLPALPGAEGRSFAPLLAGQNPDNGPVFSEWRELRAVARGSSRMRCDLRMDTCELFDIQNDPLEQRDLSRRRPEEFRELRAILRAFVMQQATAESQPATSPLVELAAGDLSALPGARAALADPDPETRAKAAALLGEHPDPASMPALLPLLDDPAREVQAEAAISLGRLGELSAAPILRRLLGTEDSNLAARAALALAALGDAGPLEISQGLLGSDEALQREALDMLSAQGEIARRDPVVLDRISALLGGPLTAEAAQVLAALGASESAPTLAEALRQATQIPARSALVQALGVLKNPVAIPALLERAAFGEGGDEVGEALLAVGATAPKDGAGGAAELAAKGRGWRCSPGGCAPLSSEETLSLRAPKTLAPRPYALLLSARGEGTLSVWLGNKLLGETTLLDEPRDLRFLLPAEALRAGRPLPLRLAIQGKLILRLAMVLPVPDDPSTRYTE